MRTQNLSQKPTSKKRPRADIIEIFSSYQGEGVYMGARQIFIRFAGCNLKCAFCDTAQNVTMKNVTPERVLKKVAAIDSAERRYHSISLTGGEPLLHVDFLECLLPALKERGYKIYLETNGTLSSELNRVIKYVDIIAMDIKLPSATEMPPLWESHRRFLEIARRSDTFVKVVVTANTSTADVVKARNIVDDLGKDMHFVLQPASPTERGELTIRRERISAFRRVAEQRLKRVSVIPQIHKYLGIK